MSSNVPPSPPPPGARTARLHCTECWTNNDKCDILNAVWKTDQLTLINSRTGWVTTNLEAWTPQNVFIIPATESVIKELHDYRSPSGVASRWAEWTIARGPEGPGTQQQNERPQKYFPLSMGQRSCYTCAF